ncbi:MAG: hypothetical protein ACI4S2_06650 [Lachnospiraceae bacterium]
MDVERFFLAYGIPYVTSGHKHARQGWVNIECPFCSGNAGYHLGYNIAKDFWTCWRCGWHSEFEVLNALVGDRSEIAKIKRLYHTNKGRYEARRAVIIKNVRNCSYPKEYELTIKARRYLEERGYDPDKIINDWGISYGGSFGEMAYRIIIPIFYDGKVISYTGRDITGLQQNKYMTAPESVQTFNPKHMLYGIDNAAERTVLVVEGPLDVWRFGYGAVGTFGIKYTREQVLLLAKRFQNIKVLYDADRKGQGRDRTASQRQAIQLVDTLANLGKKVTRCSLTDIGVKDPGDLNPLKAKKFMEELFTL